MAPIEKDVPSWAEAQANLDKHVAARKDLPSRETEKNGDVWTWLKEKAQYESRLGGADGNLWMVHGKWYDLEKFIDSHPGGPDWLRLTRGQDITEAFEVHHINTDKAWKVLKPYYVKDASEDYVGRYPWQENGFYRTIKKRVAAHFKAEGGGKPDTGPTQYFKALCAFAIAAHFLAFAAMLFRPGVLTAVLSGLTLQTFHGIGHNFLHMADNRWMFCYDFCGWKHHKHRVSHALSHHLHPNTRIDLEIAEPISFTFTCSSARNSPWVFFVAPLFIWSGPLRDILSLWQGLAKKEEPWRNEYLINMAQLALCMLAGGCVRGALCFAVMHCVCGFCIEAAGYGLHRSIFCWSAGDKNAKYDYAEHALASTADHDVDMPLLPSLYFFQILNNHGIHHIFPTVDKSRTAEIMPIFRQTCQEFNIPWTNHDWRDIFCSLWKNWSKGMWEETPFISTPAMGHMLADGSSLRITPIEGQTLGAVVTGVNVGKLTPGEFHAIKKAWVEHAVLVIKDQELTPDEELEFARRFPHSRTCDEMHFCGPLAKEGFDASEWRKFKLNVRPEIQLRGYADLEDYYGVTGQLNTGKGAKEFHSDSLHEYSTPPVFTALHCIDTPGGYDATLFLDARLAYDLLTDAARERADSLFVQYKREPSPLHESGLKADTSADLSSLGDLYGSAVAANQQEGGDVKVSEVHPLVWTHPNTGRKAVISAAMWMHRIVEADGTPWTVEASHEYVYNILKPAADRLYAHKWSPKDLVCFDNRSLMHSAGACPVKQGRRLLHQIILCGDRVPAGPAGVGVGNPEVNPNVAALR